MNIGLVLYGNINTVSGGFLYDQKVRDFLLAAGDSVETISLPWVRYGRGIINNFSSALLRRLTNASFDVFLQDELVHPSFFLLNRKLAQRLRLPIIVIVHHLRSSEFRASWKNHMYRAIEKHYLASADGFIFNSQETQRVVTSLVGDSKPSVVAFPGGDRFNQKTIRDEVVERSMKPGPLEILFVGNVIPRKELHTLVAALATIPHQPWHLTVVGDLTFAPKYASEVKHQVDNLGLTEKVDFLGPKIDEEMSCSFAKGHLLVVPSSYEGFGIVYIEAMGFGLPVIASTMGAAREIITNGIDGYLVPPGDPGVLSFHIKNLIKNREHLCAMSVAALERFSRHPTWSETGAVVHQFLHRYEAN